MADGISRSGESAASPVAEVLLHAPVATDDRPERRWAYPKLEMAALSLFLTFHLLAVLVLSVPLSDAVRPLQRMLERHAHAGDYLRTAGIARSWGVFAPEPARQNAFTRVLVEAQDGEEWDLGHDLLGRRRYPYLFYDRLAKINRQMLRRTDYRLSYAAWVCRRWERDQGGQPARAVHLVGIRTRVPTPDQAYVAMGYDPRGLNVEDSPPEIHACATTPHGQLPPDLRARYRLPGPPLAFRDVARSTWWDQRARASGGPADAGDPARADPTDRFPVEPLE
jgi:hypothetical protein